MRVAYLVLELGVLPIFGRPDHHKLRRWQPGATPRPAAWERLLRVEEGLAEAPMQVDGAWLDVTPPRGGRSGNWMLNFTDVDLRRFPSYLKEVAARLPVKQKRGSLVVAVSQSNWYGPGRPPDDYLYCGIIHASPGAWEEDVIDSWMGPAPNGLEAMCPIRVTRR